MFINFVPLRPYFRAHKSAYYRSLILFHIYRLIRPLYHHVHLRRNPVETLSHDYIYLYTAFPTQKA